MQLSLICVLLSAVVISADLQSEIREIVCRLPKQPPLHYVEVEYVQHGSHPRPAKQLRTGVQSTPEILSDESLEAFFKAPEVQELIQYFEKRGINAQQLLVNFIKESNQLRVPENSDNAATPESLLANILKSLYSPEVLALIEKKEKANPEFANLLAALRDPEFKTLFYRALNSKTSLSCENCNGVQVRGFFSKVWKKIKDIGFGVGVSGTFGK